MDTKAVFAALYSVCEENATFFSGGAKGSQGDAARRLVDVMKLIQEHARSLEPVISGFASVYHHFDFDPHIPANGYRSLVKVGCGLCQRLESTLYRCQCSQFYFKPSAVLRITSPHTSIHFYLYSLHTVRNSSPTPDISLFQGQSICFTN